MDKDYSETYGEVWGLMKTLAGKLPKPMLGYADLHREALVDGALSTKVKELIAPGIAITLRSDCCIAYHVHDTLRAGATPGEVLEAIGVTVLMGGAPSVVYGGRALEALT